MDFQHLTVQILKILKEDRSTNSENLALIILNTSVAYKMSLMPLVRRKKEWTFYNFYHVHKQWLDINNRYMWWESGYFTECAYKEIIHIVDVSL